MKNRIAAFFIIATQFYFAQQAADVQNNKFNLTIKSPDASQLSKHIDVPTTTHTGTVGIDIPIYNIKVDNYTLPISLKYHASGVKVKEVASKVGLGWSLSIGGISLSKQIINIEDRGFIPVINQADWSFQPNDRTSSDYSLANQITGFNAADPSNPFSALKRDSQPDIFSYSIPGSSGDFHLDSSGRPVKIGETSVKIEKSPFVLTDDSGNKYYFSGGNQTRTIGGAVPLPSDIAVTDYVINKIVLSNGKEIRFEYLSAAYQYLSSYYKGFRYPLYCQTSIDGVTADNEYSEYASLTDVTSESYLSKIIYPEGYTLFTYSNNRQDILGGLSLDNITVYDNGNKLVANQVLNKGYFTTTDIKNIGGYANHTNALTKRLKLTEVKNMLDNSSYKVTYYEDTPLPNRLSDATDYVGFYNGENNNLGIPYVVFGDNVYGWGDKKKPNIIYAVSGSLKELIYPTGGKMKLEYELDDFDSNTTNFIEPIVAQREEVIISGESEKSFTLNTNANINTVSFKVNFSSNLNPDNDGSNTLPGDNTAYFIGEILDNTNTVLKTFLLNGDYEFLLDKKPSYKLRMRKHKNPTVDKYANLSIRWREISYAPTVRYNQSVGGIRVNKIIKQEGADSIIEERFSYKYENGISTGVFMGDPINYYYFASSPHGYQGETCRRLVISNSGNFNLSTINGKPTVYNKVITERVNVKTPNVAWKTIDTYYNSSSSNFYNNESPFQNFVNNQFARGLLLTKEVFDSSNKLVKKMENEYVGDNYFNQKSSDYLNQFPAVTIRPYQLIVTKIIPERIPGTNEYLHIPVFDFTRYEITSSWMKLKSQKNTSYLNNQEIIETTNYLYDSDHRHLNPTILTALSPDQSISETVYQYAYEKGNQKLIDANMIGIPLETKVIQKQNANDAGKTTSRSETKYDDPANLFPTSVVSYDIQNNNASTTEVTYNKYDVKGNILQYTTKDGISTTVIWGYNNTQPIAKITGAKLSDITPSLITSIVNASNDDNIPPQGMTPEQTEQNLILALDTFRKNSALSGYQITTYSYDPLIGVTSITAPSGIREVYIYDTVNRLKEIRQDSKTGNLVKEFKYNYKL
ncbi:hypothetical protein [Chryseobacterium paridis]|uniref:YD repeat-containing protein n=1 Tax=Chryseobacterium paridis TaxID=2800328 RepID=A0ABS1G0U0_9FLAO|nr:hypothetical protein [Chryseobacterium paridis]MBK1898282.1 hypothetical protein [Chryseobacterium paridis]